MDKDNVDLLTTGSQTFQMELAAMRAIAEAMESLTDAEARRRVLSWANSLFGPAGGQISDDFPGQPHRREDQSGGEAEIPGIARLTSTGDFELTVRDLKARNTKDAAIRIAHIVIYANEKLKGERSVSSRHVLSPILKEWRAYDGNTRPALARHKGIRRDGDMLSLDAIARKDAEAYIDEVLDSSVQGTWNPRARAVRKVTPRRRQSEPAAI